MNRKLFCTRKSVPKLQRLLVSSNMVLTATRTAVPQRPSAATQQCRGVESVQGINKHGAQVEGKRTKAVTGPSARAPCSGKCTTQE